MDERKITTERIDVAPRPASQFASEVAADLEYAITFLERWMARPFARTSRPRAALDVLRDAIDTKKFTPGERGSDEALRALQLALDLKAIVAGLPPQRVADLRRELEICADGPLMPVENLQPLQAQSQLVVRAALAKAGIEPSQPSHSGSKSRKKPDILVEDLNHVYAIEVKRPSAGRNVAPRAMDASSQIKGAGLRGGVVIDATDCIIDSSPAAADAELLDLLYEASSSFFSDDTGVRPGHGHIMFLLLFARPAWTIEYASQREGQIVVHNSSAGIAYGAVKGTLPHIKGQWLRERIGLGLNMLGFTALEAERT